MRPEEQLMDELEASITKQLEEARHKMYQRITSEKSSKEGSQPKYMIRYYDGLNVLRTKVLKPVDGVSLVEAAQLLAHTIAYNKVYWVYDMKYNLIYSQSK